MNKRDRVIKLQLLRSIWTETSDPLNGQNFQCSHDSHQVSIGIANRNVINLLVYLPPHHCSLDKYHTIMYYYKV